jgi:hypothetical protein
MATRRACGCGRRSGSVVAATSLGAGGGDDGPFPLPRNMDVAHRGPPTRISLPSCGLRSLTIARAYDKVRPRMEIVPEMMNTKNAAT